MRTGSACSAPPERSTNSGTPNYKTTSHTPKRPSHPLLRWLDRVPRNPQHDRAVDPALKGCGADVHAPQQIRGIDGEAQVGQIRMSSATGSLHRPFNPLAVQPDSPSQPNLGMHASSTVGAAGGDMDLGDHCGQFGFGACPRRWPAAAPVGSDRDAVAARRTGGSAVAGAARRGGLAGHARMSAAKRRAGVLPSARRTRCCLKSEVAWTFSTALSACPISAYW